MSILNDLNDWLNTEYVVVLPTSDEVKSTVNTAVEVATPIAGLAHTILSQRDERQQARREANLRDLNTATEIGERLLRTYRG